MPGSNLADSTDASYWSCGSFTGVANACPQVQSYSEMPVMMPVMMPSTTWVPEGSPDEVASGIQCNDYAQGFQACFMWVAPIPGASVPYQVPVAAAPENESDTKNKPEKNGKQEKLSLESLLPPPAEPIGEPPAIASLESMLFDKPATTGALKSCSSAKGLPSGTTGSMKEQLRALRLVDPAAVFIVRGIKPLGTPVVQELQQYFSRFGEVTSVYAPHSRVKLNKLPTYQRAPVSRWRVANTGFVVMTDAECVKKVLENSLYVICDVLVSVHEFHRHTSVDPDGEEAEAVAEEVTADSEEAETAAKEVATDGEAEVVAEEVSDDSEEAETVGKKVGSDDEAEIVAEKVATDVEEAEVGPTEVATDGEDAVVAKEVATDGDDEVVATEVATDAEEAEAVAGEVADDEVSAGSDHGSSNEDNEGTGDATPLPFGLDGNGGATPPNEKCDATLSFSKSGSGDVTPTSTTIDNDDVASPSSASSNGDATPPCTENEGVTPISLMSVHSDATSSFSPSDFSSGANDVALPYGVVPSYAMAGTDLLPTYLMGYNGLVMPPVYYGGYSYYDAEAFVAKPVPDICQSMLYMCSEEELLNAMPEQYDD